MIDYPQALAVGRTDPDSAARMICELLREVDQPDHTVRHLVERCAGCGCSLADQVPNKIERRQVFDVPEPRLRHPDLEGNELT